MDEFGKKIASILNEAPLDKRIEDRLAQARQLALSKAKQNNFVEIQTSANGVLKAKSKLGLLNDNFKWLGWLSLGILFIIAQQGYMSYTQESEPVTYLSTEYLQYQEKLNLDQEKFSTWKEEVNNLIDKEDKE